jgi:hypothetical protein
MASKLDVRPVVEDHLNTLVDQGRASGKPSINLWDYVIQFGLPIMLGILGVATNLTLHSVSSLLAGAAIFTAFSFALAIFAFQTRQATVATKGSPQLRLLDEFFYNILYSVLVGLALTVALMVCAAVGDGHDQIGRWGAGVTITLGVHYLLVILMCIKRLRAVYRNIQR